MYSPSDAGLGMVWGGSHYSRRSQINAAGPNCDYYSNHFLGHYRNQAWGPWPDIVTTRKS